MSYLDHGSVAVIIDCWDYSQYSVDSSNYRLCQQLSQNILKIVPTLPNLTAVILSTYDSLESHDPTKRLQNIYYQNTHDLFYQQQPIPYIKKLYQQDFVRDLSKATVSNNATRTDDLILNHVWPCYQIAMNDIWQLEYYIRMVVPHVKNVFYFGRAWSNGYQMPGCVRGRPMGADRLKELKQWGHLPDVNVLLCQQGILENHPTQELFSWPEFDQYQDLGNNIYQYC